MLLKDTIADITLQQVLRRARDFDVNPNQVNFDSVVLSGEMMLRCTGWTEAPDLPIEGMDGAIAANTITYVFERLLTPAMQVKNVNCSKFGDI